MSSPDDSFYKNLEALLRGTSQVPGARGAVPPASGCPTEAEWFQAASGELSPEESLKVVEHAARCQTCAPRLHYWGAIFKDESPEEAAELAKLPVSRSRWQDRMAARMVQGERNEARRGFFSRRYLLPLSLGFSGALAAVVFFLLLPSGFRTHTSPEFQLASAYTGQRQMDLRIPMAGFAPVQASHHQRAAGADSRNDNDSVPLLEARATITQALLKSPEDNHWLALEARADVLNGDYNSAIDTLKRVLAADPSNVPALTDIASAYLLRAKATDTPADQAAALDYLEHAARLQPNNSVVLYNEAVVLDSLCQYTVEMDVWKKFLAAEKDKKWLEDGRKRLLAVEAKEKECDHNQSILAPYLQTPEGMFRLARSPALLAQRDEELLTLQLPHLLQLSFPQQGPDNNSDLCQSQCLAARTLLRALADSLETQHHDTWLKDFLAETHTAQSTNAAYLLGAALEADSLGDVGNGLKLAGRSLALFQTEENRPGILRAEAARVFELQQLFSVDQCLSALHNLGSDIETARYPWIQAQLNLDASSCEAAKTDFSKAVADIRKASSIATGAGYGMIGLRALGFLADEEYFEGNMNADWKANLEGLRLFWSGAYPLMRANQFYLNLAYAEERTNHVYSSVLFDRELLHLSTKLDHPSYEAADRFRLIQAEVRAGEIAEATDQLPQAEAFLASVPGVDKLHGYSADTHLQLAEAYLSRQAPDAAEQMLVEASLPVQTLDVPYVNLGYEEAMGRLAMQEGKQAVAQTHLDRALSIAEENFHRLKGKEERAAWSRRIREAYAASALLRLEEKRSPAQALAVWERYRLMSSGLEPDEGCHGQGFECLAPALERFRLSLKGKKVLGTTLLDGKMMTWLIDRDGIRVQQTTIDPDQFSRLTQTFAQMTATPRSSEESLRAVGLQLERGFLQQALPAFAPHQELILYLDDTMEFLPVAALPLADGEYAGQEVALSSVRSLLAASHLHASAASEAQLRASSALVVGASLPDAREAVPLPEAKVEALSVAAYLDHPTVLTGLNATARSMESAMPGTWLIHYAGHTVSSSGHTRLMLARDQSRDDAEARRIRDIGLFHQAALSKCRIVVLSACSTGSLEEHDSADPSGLVEQLADDGVPDIVATHWDVDSEAAVPLMKNFYSGLAQGLTTPQALSHAEVAVSSLGAYHHPYYWAAYYVTGMGKSTLKELIHERTSSSHPF
ncbi:CHAT domain-containing protein [Silvibacterium acidisoli]|uniref:CHAT domain-containing protein n=1 Tax=Acidobacteriaceae bacterium ZG23-2 TaxID=2883246 RepID=UPI00406C1F6D